MRALGCAPSPRSRRDEAASRLALGYERVSGRNSGGPGAGRSGDPAAAPDAAARRRMVMAAAARAWSEPGRGRPRLAMKRPRRAGNDGGEGVGGEVVAPRGAKPGRGDDLLEEGGGWRGNSVIHSTIAGPVRHVGYWSVLLTVAVAHRLADPSYYPI